MYLISLLGPTCSGKSDISVELAHFLDQNYGPTIIVNCDSRQVYKKLDIGTAKIPGAWTENSELSKQINRSIFEYRSIPHFLIDFVDPQTPYSVVDFVQDWSKLIKEIQTCTSVQYIILTGGTGLWAKAVLEDYQFGLILPQFRGDYELLKRETAKLNLQELQTLYLVQSQSQSDLNPSDFANPQRLQNWLLRYESTLQNWTQPLIYPRFESKQSFAIKVDQLELNQRILSRIETRLNHGLLAEAQSLLFLGKLRLFELGLEYRLTWFYIHGQITEKEWELELIEENQRYAKRQITWLNKQNLTWITSLQELKTNVVRTQEVSPKK